MNEHQHPEPGDHQEHPTEQIGKDAGAANAQRTMSSGPGISRRDVVHAGWTVPIVMALVQASRRLPSSPQSHQAGDSDLLQDAEHLDSARDLEGRCGIQVRDDGGPSDDDHHQFFHTDFTHDDSFADFSDHFDTETHQDHPFHSDT